MVSMRTTKPVPPSRRRPRSAALSVILSLLLAIPLGAGEIALRLGPPGPPILVELGLNIGPGPAGTDPANADLTSAYRERAIRWIRNHDYYGPLDMATLYPDRSRDPQVSSSFAFTAPVGPRGESSDDRYRDLLSGGFEAYFRIGDSYRPLAVPLPSEHARWAQAAVQVLRHYRAGLWNGFVAPIRYVEIWNEPDFSHFWPRPFAEFLDLYAATSTALRSAFPDLRIGGPGFTMNVCLRQTQIDKLRQFLDRVVAQGLPLDFLSWHIYSNQPEDWATCARLVRSELDRRGLLQVEQHVTEYNTDENFLSYPEQVAVRAGARGAAILTGAWIAMHREGVRLAFPYRGPDPSITEPRFYGIFFADGRPKRSADALRFWKRLEGMRELPIENGSAAPLHVLGAQDAMGRRYLLAANATDLPHQLQITFDDGSHLGSRTWHGQWVTDASDTVVQESATRTTWELPPFTVLLLSDATSSQGSGSLRWAAAPNPTLEGDPIQLSIERVGDASQPLTAEVQLAAGTAVAGLDLPDGPWSLHWAAGESGVKTLAVPTASDLFPEPTETATFQLRPPDGVEGPSPPFLTANLLDNDSDPSGPCAPGPETLCLGRSGRFRVRAHWRTPSGLVGWAQAVSLPDRPDSGLFTFFHPANLEVLIKVLDGCGVNEHYWTYLAGTTDVEFTVWVADTLRGASRFWINPLGSPAHAVTASDAFATCP